MNKNTIVGFVLIGVILFGFTWFQSKQYEKQVAYQAQLDSIARAERLEQYRADSIAGKLQVKASRRHRLWPQLLFLSIRIRSWKWRTMQPSTSIRLKMTRLR